jgi:cytochrome c-type biogenesis protein CcmE
MSPVRQRRGLPRRLLLLLAVVGLLLLSLGATLRHTLVYYRTPSEIAAHPLVHTRLAGAVLPGTMQRRSDGELAFDVTDGHNTVHVLSLGTPPRMFREGRQAVLEGALAPDGVFHADRVLAKHGSVYRPPGP